MASLYTRILSIIVIVGSMSPILISNAYASITNEWKIRTVGDIEFNSKGKEVASSY